MALFVLSLCPWHFCWCRGFCHMTESDLFLFVFELSVAEGVRDQHDLWPTDLNINRGYQLIKDYRPAEYEAPGAMRSLVFNCTICWRPTLPLTLTFDLLTWISIGIIFSSRTIYLLSCLPCHLSAFNLKYPWVLCRFLLRSSWRKAFISYQLHKVWKTNITFDLVTWILIGIINSSKDYVPTKFWSSRGKACLSYQLNKVWKTNITFDLDLLAWTSIEI